MLIDVHVHFFSERSSRPDWQEYNSRRLEYGSRMGIDVHVASILGSWGRNSPTYFPSVEDLRHANEKMLEIQRAHPEKVFGYCLLNPNYPEVSLKEAEARLGEGMVGLKLLASRRATDPLIDPIAEFAAQAGKPILHHIWQHRQRDWPGQEASDALELCELAGRHPGTSFILAHIGGGGDWQHTVRAVRNVPNVWVDLSGSGLDGGMLEAVLDAVPPSRILWGTDLTMDTGWAKLRYLESLELDRDALESIRWKNAARLFGLRVP